ncbi:MAG: hypothetical protein JNM33_17900 [Rubrivivax sp.]|nr:hypothetical protein [Rubrivivax sp.]
MIKYANLGLDKQLNEIVIVGSHDAGVTGGDPNTQTQSLDIFGQAEAGVRFFDIRITGAVVKKGGASDVVTLKAYHGKGPSSTKTAVDLRTGQTGKVEVKSLWGGDFGLSLTNILNDALRFVTKNSTEFLILKFDKCANWDMIADACRSILGSALLSGRNLNTATLRELQGKVICAFMTKGYTSLKLPGQNAGISHITNLYKPPAGYSRTFPGLQYWGSGGTPINNHGFEKKIGDNISKQTKILTSASTGISEKKRTFKKNIPGCSPADPNAIGMMYWTTTGVNKSIKERNELMWDKDHRGGLEELWRTGFASYINNALPKSVDACSFSSGGTLKLFMPNIVMIDFADEDKCEYIYGLNTVAAIELVKICQKLDIHGGHNSL